MKILFVLLIFSAPLGAMHQRVNELRNRFGSNRNPKPRCFSCDTLQTPDTNKFIRELRLLNIEKKVSCNDYLVVIASCAALCCLGFGAVCKNGTN